MLSTLADIFGILSFILTIILLVRSESLRNQIVFQKITYRTQQSDIIECFKQFRISLINKDTLSLKDISDIREKLEWCDVNLNHMLSARDRKLIKITLSLLDEDFSDDLRKRLLKNFDQLSARLSKQEV